MNVLAVRDALEAQYRADWGLAWDGAMRRRVEAVLRAPGDPYAELLVMFDEYRGAHV